jgi:CheY-like chemotaxis protein
MRRCCSACSTRRSHIDLAIDIKPWPAHARESCRFATRLSDELDGGTDERSPSSLDSLTWRLVEQTAWTMGLIIDRTDTAQLTTLTLEFPRTASNAIEGVSAMEIDDGFAPSGNSQPLAGNHVLVIASQRELRTQIRDVLRDMGLIIDFVNSVDEAAAFCRDGLPHAIVIEATQCGEPFAQLRAEIAADVPDFVFIEILEQGSAFEMSGFSGATMSRVGRDALASALPSALMFELSKGL